MPNLETKFIAANSLIGLKRTVQGPLKSLKTSELESDLHRVRNRYFNDYSPKDKENDKKEDKRLREELLIKLKKAFTIKNIKKMAS